MRRATTTFRAVGAALTILTLMTACSPAPSASVSPSAEPTSTVFPEGLRVTLVGDEPVLAGRDLRDEASAILPGALLIVDGVFHAFFVAFGGGPDLHWGYHATSPDGQAWLLSDGDPLAGIDLDLSQPGPLPSSVLLEADGTWVMYLWGVPSGQRYGSQIWRGSARSPAGPWTVDPEPVLVGDAGTWDASGVSFASVIQTADGYLMAYDGSGEEEPDIGAIGLATSSDGITWTKRPGPIIAAGFCGNFDALAANRPLLIENDGRFLIAYSGYVVNAVGASIGLASSDDGEAWSCDAASPILERADVPQSQGIHTIALASGPDGPRLLIESLIGAGSELWLAELADPTE